MFDIESILVCPVCKTSLKQEDNVFFCAKCNSQFERKHNIYYLLANKEAELNGMKYVEHYTSDAELFDYFEERVFGATIHEERRVRESVLSELPDDFNAVLDIGSGSAWVANSLAGKHIVISFDISSKNIEKALELYPDKNHYGVIGDALNPPFINESFDCIITSEVIEHIVDPEIFLNSLFSLLKPGGRLIVSTPYKEKLQYYLCVHCNKMTPKNAHLHSFDEHKLLKYLNLNNVKKRFNIFGNKALILFRTHIFLKFLPLGLWKIIDKLANFVINKPLHIVVVYEKK